MTIAPDATTIQYYTSGNVLWTVESMWSLLLPALIFFSGLSQKMSRCAQRICPNRIGQLSIYLFLFIALYTLASLPLSFYASYFRLREYGLATISLGGWAVYMAKQRLLLYIGGVALLWIPYALIRKSPKRWWLWMWLISIPLVIFFALIKPMVIDPLFYDFYPMKDKALEARITELTSRAHIEGSRIYEVGMSRHTKSMNAYMVGIGPSKQIVLWDTTIKGLSERELLFVMAHEMAHCVLGHIWWQIASTLLVILFLLWVLHIGGSWFAKKGGVPLSDYATLPLFLFLFNGASLITDPLENWLSRRHEWEADQFGLELVQDNEAAIGTFVKLQGRNLSYPSPGWYFMAWRGTHPSLNERIQYAEGYRPWEKGKPLTYSRYFTRK